MDSKGSAFGGGARGATPLWRGPGRSPALPAPQATAAGGCIPRAALAFAGPGALVGWRDAGQLCRVAGGLARRDPAGGWRRDKQSPPSLRGRGRVNQHDEDAFSAASLVRRVRWRRRLTLPGEAGDPQFLVSDLAGPAGRAGAGQPADRRAAGGDRAAGGTDRGAPARAVRDPYLLALVCRRREGGRGAEGRQPGAEDRLRRRQGRGAAG